MLFLTAKKNLLTCLIFLLLPGAIIAQVQSRGIFVVNAFSRVPIPDILLFNDSAGVYKTTDANGFVSLEGKFKNLSQLQISAIGFESLTINLDSLSFETNQAVIGLHSRVANLQEIKLVSSPAKGIFKTI